MMKKKTWQIIFEFLILRGVSLRSEEHRMSMTFDSTISVFLVFALVFVRLVDSWQLIFQLFISCFKLYMYLQVSF